MNLKKVSNTLAKFKKKFRRIRARLFLPAPAARSEKRGVA